jgi:hypothetical protein
MVSSRSTDIGCQLALYVARASNFPIEFPNKQLIHSYKTNVKVAATAVLIASTYKCGCPGVVSEKFLSK